MRFLILMLVLVLYNSSLGQSRKSILKEISSSKYEFYRATNYKTSSENLRWVLKNYFAKQLYSTFLEKDSTITFVKKVTVSCSLPPDGTNEIRAERYEKCSARFYVHIRLATIGELKSVVIKTKLEEYNQPFTVVYRKRQLGNYTFNKLHLYQHLHQHFNKEKFQVSLVLQSKINTYNSKQTNEKKKINLGKSY